MKMSDIQKRVDDQIRSYGDYWRPMSMFLRLVEETGELARAVNIKYGDKKSKSASDGREVRMELVDVLYTTVALCNYYKLDLDQIPEINRQDLNDIQANDKQGNETVDYLAALLKLTSKIGKFAEAMDKNNNDLTKYLTTIILEIIDIANTFEINLTKEFKIKVGEDEIKMTKIYKE